MDKHQKAAGLVNQPRHEGGPFYSSYSSKLSLADKHQENVCICKKLRVSELMNTTFDGPSVIVLSNFYFLFSLLLRLARCQVLNSLF